MTTYAPTHDSPLEPEPEPEPGATSDAQGIPERCDALVRWGSLAALGSVFVATIGVFVFSPENVELEHENAGYVVLALNRYGVRATGLLSGLFLFLQLIALARIPQVERLFDRGRILTWHAAIGSALLLLLLVHVAVRTYGLVVVEAQQDGMTGWQELALFYSDWRYLAAGLAFLSLLAVAGSSAVRRRLRRVFWHRIHLLAYVAVLAALPHELAHGTTLGTRDPATAMLKVLWIAMLLLAFGAVVMFRVVLPVRLNRRYRLRVVHREWVNDDGDLFHVLIASETGEDLTGLHVEPGQYGQWYWEGRWRSWPTASCFTVSDIVPVTARYTHPVTGRVEEGPVLRLTMRVKIPVHAGRPGQYVYLAGPYGRFTPEAAGTSDHRKILVLVNGTGATPMLPLVKEFVRQMATDPLLEVSVVQRVSHENQLLFRNELEDLVRRAAELSQSPGPARLQWQPVIGHRARVSRWGAPTNRRGRTSWLPPQEVIDGEAAALLRYGAPILDREIYLCGSPDWSRKVRRTLRALGVHSRQVHEERFS